MLALSLIDSGLILAARRGDAIELIDEQPGIAVLEESIALTGKAAAARVRLRPLLAHTNYWRGINVDPLARPSRSVRTSAEIAFEQLGAMLQTHRNDPEGLLLAVPAGYSREQLGLLLGVVSETGAKVAGLVDASLAACSLEPAPARLLHLEIELHQAMLTVLDYVGGDRAGLKRSRYEIAPRHGLLALQQTWMQVIAEAFVRKTRFDPLHDALSEQRLLDALPGWLGQLREQSLLGMKLTFDGRDHEIELEREQFIASAATHYTEFVNLVQAARVAGMPIELRISGQIAVLPGLLERLQSLRDCKVTVLPAGAAAIGALRHEQAIRRPAESLALVYQLPVQRVAGAADVAPGAMTPAPLRPTHVLFQGRAWRITDLPLAIGWSTENAPRGLLLPAATPGVSRSHCSLVHTGGSVYVEDHSTYGSFVNEERVVGRTVLTVGDRLRLGSPGVTLELIQMVNDDGSPQN